LRAVNQTDNRHRFNNCIGGKQALLDYDNEWNDSPQSRLVATGSRPYFGIRGVGTFIPIDKCAQGGTGWNGAERHEAGWGKVKRGRTGWNGTKRDQAGRGRVKRDESGWNGAERDGTGRGKVEQPAEREIFHTTLTIRFQR